MTITDITGRNVFEQKNISDEIQIDSKDFTNGIYFVQTTNEKIILNKKIIIKK